jgi:hypothetical protein
VTGENDVALIPAARYAISLLVLKLILNGIGFCIPFALRQRKC